MVEGFKVVKRIIAKVFPAIKPQSAGCSAEVKHYGSFCFSDLNHRSVAIGYNRNVFCSVSTKMLFETVEMLRGCVSRDKHSP
jgi:hypothetical protein